eukprot:594240-Amorphochlora_amoeboformis.AAC.2
MPQYYIVYIVRVDVALVPPRRDAYDSRKTFIMFQLIHKKVAIAHSTMPPQPPHVSPKLSEQATLFSLPSSPPSSPPSGPLTRNIRFRFHLVATPLHQGYEERYRPVHARWQSNLSNTKPKN